MISHLEKAVAKLRKFFCNTSGNDLANYKHLCEK